VYFLNANLRGVKWLMNLTWRQAVKAWGLRAAAEFAARHQNSGLPIGRKPWQHTKAKRGRRV
jgi:hypothetical protein